MSEKMPSTPEPGVYTEKMKDVFFENALTKFVLLTAELRKQFIGDHSADVGSRGWESIKLQDMGILQADKEFIKADFKRFTSEDIERLDTLIPLIEKRAAAENLEEKAAALNAIDSLGQIAEMISRINASYTLDADGNEVGVDTSRDIEDVINDQLNEAEYELSDASIESMKNLREALKKRGAE